MKKLKTLVLAILISSFWVCSVSFAEKPDLTTLSREELTELISAAQEELASRVAEETATDLYSDWNITISSDGDWYFDMFGSLCIPCVIENNSSLPLHVYMGGGECAGWSIDDSFSVKVGENKKQRSEIIFHDFKKLSGISSVEGIESIKGEISYYREDTFETVNTSDILTWFRPVSDK